MATVKELQAKAKAYGIKGRSKMNFTELLSIVSEYERQEQIKQFETKLNESNICYFTQGSVFTAKINENLSYTYEITGRDAIDEITIHNYHPETMCGGNFCAKITVIDGIEYATFLDVSRALGKETKMTIAANQTGIVQWSNNTPDENPAQSSSAEDTSSSDSTPASESKQAEVNNAINAIISKLFKVSHAGALTDTEKKGIQSNIEAVNACRTEEEMTTLLNTANKQTLIAMYELNDDEVFISNYPRQDYSMDQMCKSGIIRDYVYAIIRTRKDKAFHEQMRINAEIAKWKPETLEEYEQRRRSEIVDDCVRMYPQDREEAIKAKKSAMTALTAEIEGYRKQIQNAEIHEDNPANPAPAEETSSSSLTSSPAEDTASSSNTQTMTQTTTPKFEAGKTYYDLDREHSCKILARTAKTATVYDINREPHRVKIYSDEYGEYIRPYGTYTGALHIHACKPEITAPAADQDTASSSGTPSSQPAQQPATVIRTIKRHPRYYGGYSGQLNPDGSLHVKTFEEIQAYALQAEESNRRMWAELEREAQKRKNADNANNPAHQNTPAVIDNVPEDCANAPEVKDTASAPAIEPALEVKETTPSAPAPEVKPARKLPTPKSRNHIYNFSYCKNADTLRKLFTSASLDTVKFIAESYREFQPADDGKKKTKKFYVDAIVKLYFPNEQPAPAPAPEVKKDKNGLPIVNGGSKFIPGKIYVAGTSNYKNELNPNPDFIRVTRRTNDTITVQVVSPLDFQPIFKPVSKKVKQFFTYRNNKALALYEYITLPNYHDLDVEDMCIYSLCEYNAMFMTGPGYDVDFDETCYTPDYQENLAVFDDVPADRVNIPAPTEKNEIMPVVVAPEVKNTPAITRFCIGNFYRSYEIEGTQRRYIIQVIDRTERTIKFRDNYGNSATEKICVIDEKYNEAKEVFEYECRGVRSKHYPDVYAHMNATEEEFYSPAPDDEPFLYFTEGVTYYDTQNRAYTVVERKGDFVVFKDILTGEKIRRKPNHDYDYQAEKCSLYGKKSSIYRGDITAISTCKYRENPPMYGEVIETEFIPEEIAAVATPAPDPEVKPAAADQPAPVKKSTAPRKVDSSNQILICFDDDNAETVPAPKVSKPKQKRQRRTSRRKKLDESNQLMIVFDDEETPGGEHNQGMAA